MLETDLMVNDLLIRTDLTEDRLVKVLGIFVINHESAPMKYVVDVYDFKSRYNYELYPFEIKPINLTTEILDSIGFEKVSTSPQLIYSHKENINFFLYKNEFGFYFDLGKTEVRINYLHELQHIMKLYGIDNNIENMIIKL